MSDALPVIELPASEVQVGDGVVAFRGMSRGEVIRMRTEYRGNPDGAENFIIATATGIPLEDVAAWRDSTPPDDAGKLIDAILILTGLAEPPEDEDEDGPKGRPRRKSTSAPS